MTNCIYTKSVEETSSDCKYTANIDCCAYIYGYRASAICDGDIYLNEKLICQQYLHHDYENMYMFIPLKAGDTIKFNTNNYWKGYSIYGVR